MEWESSLFTASRNNSRPLSQTSSKSTTWKGKPTTNPTRSTAIEASDESGTGSDISGSDNDRRKSESNDSEGEDSDPEGEEDDFGATRMIGGEAQRMFDEEMPRDLAALFDDDYESYL